MNIYESDVLLSQYLEFHYGSDYFGVPNYPVACINYSMEFCHYQSRLKALDLGCSVGRATFELAKHFAHVDGIDFSTKFIQQAIKLQTEGVSQFSITTEGDLVENKEFKLSIYGYEKLTNKINFSQGDACDLKSKFKDYDFIFCGNLIDRLYDPALFLQNIKERLVLGGILVLTSPYTWLEEFTKKEKWLGGIHVNGEEQTTLTGLKLILAPQFELLDVRDLPFVIRETQRKFHHTIAQMTVWKLKDAHN